VKCLREKSGRLVDEPLSRVAHVFPAEHSLRVLAVHYIANQTLMPPSQKVSQPLSVSKIRFCNIGGEGRRGWVVM
jgi:hypothetical protein